jgi:hypothetical protein
VELQALLRRTEDDMAEFAARLAAAARRCAADDAGAGAGAGAASGAAGAGAASGAAGAGDAAACAALRDARLGGGGAAAAGADGGGRGDAPAAVFAAAAAALDAHAAAFAAARARRDDAVERLMWSEDDGLYHDLFLVDGDATAAAAAGPRRWRVAPPPPGVASLSSWAPLLFRAPVPGPARARRLLASLRASGLVQAAGVASTSHGGDEQWDGRNAWAPLQGALVDGLLATGEPGARALAAQVARRWLLSTFVSHREDGYVHEKMSAAFVGFPGGGGEYAPQTGKAFGRMRVKREGPTRATGSCCLSPSCRLRLESRRRLAALGDLCLYRSRRRLNVAGGQSRKRLGEPELKASPVAKWKKSRELP